MLFARLASRDGAARKRYAGTAAPPANAIGSSSFDGKRLYTFVKDEPGEITGDGLSDAFDGQRFTWHAVSVGDAPDSNQNGGDTGDSAGY